MSKLLPLTDEEKRLAEENLYMVDRFLRERRLDPGEYYDVVVFGYLEAIQSVCQKRSAEKTHNLYGFCTFCMREKLWKEHRRIFAGKRQGDRTALSIDQPLRSQDDNSQSLSDVLADMQQDPARQVEALDLIRRVLYTATEKEKVVVDLTLMGYAPKEIAAVLGTSILNVRNQLYRFRIKAKAVRDGREPVSYWQLCWKRKKRLSDVADRTDAHPKGAAYPPSSL